MARPTVIAVPVLGEGLSLPLTFGTLRALRAFGLAQVPAVDLLPSQVITRDNLVNEEVAVLTLAAASIVVGKPVSPDQVVGLARMGEIRKLATEIHTKLVLMFGPEEAAPSPKAEPPAQ